MNTFTIYDYDLNHSKPVNVVLTKIDPISGEPETVKMNDILEIEQFGDSTIKFTGKDIFYVYPVNIITSMACYKGIDIPDIKREADKLQIPSFMQ